MIRKRVVDAAVLLGVLLASASSAAIEVKLTASETDGIARSPAHVTTGVPFPKGAVTDVSKLAVANGGKPIPAQIVKTVPWDDGSVRWALLDTQVPVAANGRAELVLSDAGNNPAPAAPVKVTEGADGVSVSTGPLQFKVSRAKAGLFQSITVDGKELVKESAKGLLIVKEDGSEAAAGAPSEVKVELAGPLRTVVLVKGSFPQEIHAGRIGYTARISAFAGSKLLKIRFWLENQGSLGIYRSKRTEDDDPTIPDNLEWFVFKGMSVNLDLGLGDTVTAACEGAEVAGNLKVMQVCRPKAKDLHREPIYTYQDLDFTVGSNSNVLKKGDRTEGVVTLKGGGAAATVAIRDFWQNYEKAIEFDGRSVRLWLWPVGGRYPRYEPTLYSRGTTYFDTRLDAYAKKMQLVNGYSLQGSVHKGYEFAVDFSGRDPKESWAELSRPLFALAGAEHYAASGALPGFVAPPSVRTGTKICDIKLGSWLRMIQSAASPTNPASVYRGREITGQSSHYSFGWMDFGDLCTGSYASPAGDWPWLLLANGLRTGDVNHLRLATEMARHRIDVDTLWSERELPEIRGLTRTASYMPFHLGRLRWVPGPGDIGLQGMALYYMLTGEPKALECALLGGQALKGAQARAGRSVAVNAGMISCECALFDLTADKAWLDAALGLFRANIVPTWKQVGPFLHDPFNQIRSQDYVQEDAAYFHNIGVFCELHRRTGDAAVLQMLQEAAERPCPESFLDATLYSASLYAYVGMVTRNDALIDKGVESFLQGFPISRCPPVFLVNNQVWPGNAAGMMRSGNILQYAIWKSRQGK
jgi:hypothetical protein